MAAPGTKFPTHDAHAHQETQDWNRLSKCITPTLKVDYTSFLSKSWDSMPASEYIAMASSPSVLGNPLLKTQHFVSGATRWEKISDDEVVGHHQLRVPHQRYKDDTFKEVEVKGHAHSRNKHWYKKSLEDGVWRFAGLAVDIYWFEGDFERVFEEGRGAHADQGTNGETTNGEKKEQVKAGMDAAKIQVEAQAGENAPGVSVKA
ncbi:MAG: succinate dehydrogenase flavoprotein subunit [Alyxoria varia]|nr:MAG: succinate dehydrogenase flavoprotein subunit [Alyxoria varia]